MPEYILQLWAAMVFSSANPFRTLRAMVPSAHWRTVMARVGEMQRRRDAQLAR